MGGPSKEDKENQKKAPRHPPQKQTQHFEHLQNESRFKAKGSVHTGKDARHINIPPTRGMGKR